MHNVTKQHQIMKKLIGFIFSLSQTKLKIVLTALFFFLSKMGTEPQLLPEPESLLNLIQNWTKKKIPDYWIRIIV